MKLVCVQEKALLSLSVCKTLALARHTIGFIGSCGRLGRRRAPRQTPAHRRGLHGRRGVRTQTAFAAPRRHEARQVTSSASCKILSLTTSGFRPALE